MRLSEGMEVVATGAAHHLPGQSKYQLVIEDLVPAGAGALMAMLERRRTALAAEGLFERGPQGLSCHSCPTSSGW